MPKIAPAINYAPAEVIPSKEDAKDENKAQASEDSKAKRRTPTLKLKPKLDVEQARFNRQITTVNWGPEKDFQLYSIWHYPSKLFYDYGIGVYLYFEFTKITSFVCFTLAGMCAVPLYLEWGNFGHLDRDPFTPFEQASYGNLQPDYRETDIYSRLITYCMYYKWRAVDIICIFLFQFYLMWYKRHISKQADEQDESTTSASDYTIKVSKFPPKVEDRDEIRKYFDNWPCAEDESAEISDVAISFDDGTLIEEYAIYGNLTRKLKAEEKILKEAEDRKTQQKKSKSVKKLKEQVDKSIKFTRKLF